MQFGIRSSLPQGEEAISDARIKIQAADFEVVEVDLDGVVCPTTPQEVSSSSYHHPVIPPNPNKKDSTKEPKEVLKLEALAKVEDALVQCGQAPSIAEQLGALAAKGGDPVVLAGVSDKATRGVLRLTIAKVHPELDTTLQDDTLSVSQWKFWTLFSKCLGESSSRLLRWKYSERVGFELRLPFAAGIDKDARREFYAALTQHMPLLKCRTADGVLVCRLPEKKQSGSKRDRTEAATPGVYTHFLAKKVNVDVFELRDIIAKQFNVRPTEVLTAGIKDKRAITVQRCSVPQDITGRWKDTNIINVELPAAPGMTRSVSFFGAATQAEALYVGALKGNKFSVAVYTSNTSMGKRLAAFSSNPTFPNYFGPQRFGQVVDLQGHIGIHAVRGDFAAAVATCFVEVDEDDSSAESKRLFRDTGDVGAALKIAPDRNRDLTLVLQQLAKRKANPKSCSAQEWNDHCEQALLALPFHLRQIWMHAAQSLVFNLTLSKLMEGNSFSVTNVLFRQAGKKAQVSLATTEGTGKEDQQDVVLPLLGSNCVEEIKKMSQDQEDSVVMRALMSTLEELHIPSLDSFCNNVLKVSLPGSWRQALVEAKAFRCHELSRGAALEFQLPSSAYATCLLHHVLGCFPQSGGDEGDCVE